MQKPCSLSWGANLWHMIWLIVLSIWAGTARYTVIKFLCLDKISGKHQTLHRNAHHGKTLVLFSLGKESVEITSKNDRETEGVSICLPPPGGAIAATKCMSLTYHTPIFLHQNQKWLNFFSMSLPNPQTQWICLLSLHKLSLMDSVKHSTLCLCY